MIILGIDPGIATLGYGVVDKDRSGNCRAIDYGVVLTPKEETLPVRLAILEEGVNRVIDRFSPEEIAMEELFFSKNITTASLWRTREALPCSPASKNAADCTNIPPCRSSRP